MTATGPSHPSIAVATKSTIVPSCPAGASTEMFVGQEMTGASVSITTTLKAQLAVPARFEAVQLTILVPTGNA
jgi:hypothetical protein